MKVLFSVYGYGLGHATRCEAIIKKINSKNKIIASDNAYDYFNKKGMAPSRINSFKIGSLAKSFSWLQTLFENIDLPFNMINDYNLMKNISQEFKPNLIVSDTEPISILYAHTAKITNYFLSNIAPIIHEYKKLPQELKSTSLDSQEAVIRLVIDFVMKRSKAIISPTIKKYDDDKIKYTDLIVRQKPHELESIEEIRKKHELPDDYILVSFGGAQITSEYYKNIIPVLKKSKDNFIISTNGAVKQVTNINNVRLYPFINDYLSILKASKAVISLAGHSTISEALVYGKPNMVIPIKDHVEQLINAVIINNQGYGKAMLSDLKPKKFQESLKEFTENLNDYSARITRAVFKGVGDEETANLIMSKALK